MPELNDYPGNEKDSTEERLRKALALIAHQRLCLRYVKRKLTEFTEAGGKGPTGKRLVELIEKIDEAL